jgi:hypothetical protein
MSEEIGAVKMVLHLPMDLFELQGPILESGKNAFDFLVFQILNARPHAVNFLILPGDEFVGGKADDGLHRACDERRSNKVSDVHALMSPARCYDPMPHNLAHGKHDPPSAVKIYFRPLRGKWGFVRYDGGCRQEKTERKGEMNHGE